MSMVYRIGNLYRDTGTTSKEEDQFLRWINIDGSGMLNSPGIRPVHHVKRQKDGIPAYIVLVTTEKKGTSHNPWDDVVDYSSGHIYYWGDAKFDPVKKHNEFNGNRVLELAYNLVLEQKYDLVPPILHFSKPEKGWVKFNGVCVLDKLELTWFEDKGVPVRNYRCHLTVLDQDEVSLDWLHGRVKSSTEVPNVNLVPPVWTDYLNGKTRKLNLWKSQIRPKDQQLPVSNSPDAKILDRLSNLSPTQFEAVAVAMFRQLPGVTHSITQTRPTADGGFDFFGHFVLPHPLSYTINFLGEAKKYNRESAIQPKHISRLVARLGRGEYGIFVTTSYYTRQAQQEVLEDGYPVKLFSGSDIILFLKELRLIQSGKINEDLFRNIL